MSVQTSNRNRVLPGKSATVYLMELRRRTAETSGKRQKLEVSSWARPEVDTIPIGKRPLRTAQKARS
jgi:hypothetical protein